MANATEYSAKLLLDWMLTGAAATQPGARYVGLALGTPNSRYGSEVLPASGYVRQSLSMGAANSPAGTCSNAVAMTFTFVSPGTVQGLQVWDTSAFTAGNMLVNGTLQTARTVLSGDSVYIAVGGLTVGLS